MSTVAEIKEAISKLPEDKKQEIASWVQGICPPRFTDDGFDIEETKTRLQAAASGSFRKWTDEDWQRLHDSVK